MKLAPSLRHSLAGRRAVAVAGAAGLLALIVSAVDGGGPLAHHLTRRGSSPELAQAVPAAASAPAPGPEPDAMAAKAASLAGRAADQANNAGMRLLAQAAAAARITSYQGVQVISWWTPDGSGSWLGAGAGHARVDVWHRSGFGTLTRMAAAGAVPGGQWQVTEDPDGQLPDGVLGLTPRLISLLDAHYAVLYAGAGSAGGRPARIVEAVRADGSLAAKFWLDSATKLPLRRELYDARKQVISDDAFSGLTLGAPAPAPAGAAAFRLRPWPDHLGSSQLAALRAAGWPVPGARYAGLFLFDATEKSTAAGTVVDLSFSDGLSVVSLFLQRGQLPAGLPGWRVASLGGHPVYVRDPAEPSLTWAARGFVFTVVADAPAPVVAQMVDGLPHDGGPGFWGRISRGVKRLLSWVNPFR